MLFNCNFCMFNKFLHCFNVVNNFWLLNLRFSLDWFLNYLLFSHWFFRDLDRSLDVLNVLFLLEDHCFDRMSCFLEKIFDDRFFLSFGGNGGLISNQWELLNN